MTSSIQSKSARIDVRASAAVKQLLQEAAHGGQPGIGGSTSFRTGQGPMGDVPASFRSPGAIQTPP